MEREARIEEEETGRVKLLEHVGGEGEHMRVLRREREDAMAAIEQEEREKESEFCKFAEIG